MKRIVIVLVFATLGLALGASSALAHGPAGLDVVVMGILVLTNHLGWLPGQI